MTTAPSPTDTAPGLAKDVQRRGMRAAILSACWKVVTSLTFTNGLMLLFLNALGMSGPAVVLLLSLGNILQALLLLPCAHLSDRYGKMRLGSAGVALCGVGFCLVPLAGFVPGAAWVRWALLVTGIGGFGVGLALQMGGWFALLADVVPEEKRGRFFSRMRISWQATNIVLALLVAFFLPADSPLWLLCLVLTGAAVTVLPWWWYYRRIPEVANAHTDDTPLPSAILAAARVPNYAPFCSYVFIIQLFTGSCPVLFGLVEKQALRLADGQVVLLANLTMVGGMMGFWLGGRAVDRFGTKPLFLVCHFAYGIVLLLFLFRDLTGLPLVVTLGIIHILFGLPQSASSIAIATEMLALIPPWRRSLSTSLCHAFNMAGIAGSGVLVAWGLRLGLFSSQWTFLGQTRGACDAVLLVCAVLIMTMTVTLGLVPSVIGKPQQSGREV